MRHWRSALIGFLSSFCQPANRVGCPASTKADRTLTLERGAVIRLAKPEEGSRVLIQQGILWLTGTPDGGDVLLLAGQEFALTGQGPLVIEALSAANIILRSQT